MFTMSGVRTLHVFFFLFFMLVVFCCFINHSVRVAFAINFFVCLFVCVKPVVCGRPFLVVSAVFYRFCVCEVPLITSYRVPFLFLCRSKRRLMRCGLVTYCFNSFQAAYSFALAKASPAAVPVCRTFPFPPL